MLKARADRVQQTAESPELVDPEADLLRISISSLWSLFSGLFRPRFLHSWQRMGYRGRSNPEFVCLGICSQGVRFAKHDRGDRNQIDHIITCSINILLYSIHIFCFFQSIPRVDR